MGGGLESRWGSQDQHRKTRRAKNTSITLPGYIKLAFYFISWGRCTVKQPSKYLRFRRWKCSKYIMNERMVMRTRNKVGAWHRMELTAKQKGLHIYTSPWDRKRCVAERWISPDQISISVSILTKTGTGLQHSDNRNARYIACHLHISVGHLRYSTITAHDHNYLQQKETRISMII